MKAFLKRWNRKVFENSYQGKDFKNDILEIKTGS